MDTWQIATADDEVVGLAENAECISALVSRIAAAVRAAEAVDPIWELSQSHPSVGRSVIQLLVSPDVFDTFFNSSLGYRALFRRGPRIGCAANAAIVASFHAMLASTLPEALSADVIEFGPMWKGRATIARSDFLRSLDPSLAKVWYSTAEIRPNGEIRPLPTGVSNAKIDVGLAYQWASIRQDPGDCFLEVKGAFVGPWGLFQPKDPELRARTLSTKGEA